ncbi:MAG: PQQ-dependent sugar dehydrogenase [Phycisphaerales bacterium]
MNLNVFGSIVVGVCVAGAGGGAVLAQDGAPPSSATGMWITRCAACHGENGGGVEGRAKSLLTDAAMEESNDRPFFELLRKAAGPHSANGGESDRAGSLGLTEQQTWALIVHLRELQAKDWRKRVGDLKRGADGAYATQRAKFKVESVIDSGLKTPWSIAWMPAAPTKESPAAYRALVTEKDGQLDVYEGLGVGGKLLGRVSGLPKLASNGQGGLMDVAVHPDYAHNGWVYLTFAESNPQGGGKVPAEMTKVVRGKITQTESHDSDEGSFAFTDQQVIFQPRPGHYNGAGVHYGSRIVFERPTGGDVKEANGRWLVYFSIGERGGMEQAQSLELPNGKVHRVWEDGQVPSSNPFADQEKAYGTIWTIGHRNQQGLCFDDNGALWDTEHGPRGGDELNLLTRGADYGWPQSCFGINYSDQPFVLPWKEKASNGMPITLPVHRWLPSIAACGLDCARSADVKSTFPDWSGDLFAGGLAGASVDRIRIKDGKVAELEEIVHGMGRIRDVAFGPDGMLYLVLNGPDKVVRLVPAK